MLNVGGTLRPRKTVTLKGERIAEEFQEIVEQYVARRFTRLPGASP